MSTTDLFFVAGLLVILVLIGIIVYLLRQRPERGGEVRVQPPGSQTKIHSPAPKLEPELGLVTCSQPLYAQRDYVISYQERNFYEMVRELLDRDYDVLTQIRMADIVKLTNDPKDKGRYINYILTRHIDFVICDMRPKAPKALIGIELDDPTHRYRDRSESDEFKNSVFKQVGLPLLRFRVGTYSRAEVDFQIRKTLEEIEARKTAVNAVT